MISRIILFIAILLLSHSGYSQGFINLKKSAIKSEFLKYCAKDSVTCTITETAAMLTLSASATTVSSIDIFCYFNKKGKCIEEVRKFGCDSCSEKFVNLLLAAKGINWHKIDSTNYISGMGKNLFLHIINAHSYSVKYLKPKEYVLLRKKYREAKREN